MNKILPINHMEIINIEVSEKINNKDLGDFVKNSLLLNNKFYDENDRILAFYIEEIFSYEIIIVNSIYEYLPAEIFIINYEKSKKTISLDLYLCDDFFCIYKNTKLYYVQKIDYDVDINELISYINQKLKLKIDTYKQISSNELEIMKEEFLSLNQKSTLININKNSNNAFKVYIVYLFILFGISFFYFNIYSQKPHVNHKVEDNSSKIKELKKKYLYKYFDSELSDLLLNIKKYKLVLKEIDYKNKNLKLILSSSTKANLYSFLMEYKKRLLENSITYLEKNKIYECVLNVKTIR